jgi:hypothetical protein
MTYTEYELQPVDFENAALEYEFDCVAYDTALDVRLCQAYNEEAYDLH